MTRAMTASHGALAQLHVDRRAYQFDLPYERIAQEPAEARGRDRGDARMLVAFHDQDVVEHRRFDELGDYLRPDDVIVVNNAKVVPSVLHGHDCDGNPVVVQIFSPLDDGTWHAMAIPDRVCRKGATVSFGSDATTGTFLHEEEEHVWRFRLEPGGTEILEEIGEYLYPWYLKSAPAHPDYYQTVYACSPGATGLPSAGRHLTPKMVDKITGLGVKFVQVTLDIAVRWTYHGFSKHFWELARPDADADEPPHMFEVLYGPPRAERYSISLATADTINECRRNGGRVTACGTSALRTLETVTDEHGHVYPGSGWTSILISPGHTFHACDAFLTNFHMPMSTELLLTAAVLGGRDKLLDLYRDDVLPRDYSFHEFGDSMLITGEARPVIPHTTEQVPDTAGEDPRHGLTGG